MSTKKKFCRVSSVLAILCVLYASGNLYAQSTAGRLVMIGRNSPDSVVLRWAPTMPSLWSRANRYGYRLERVILEESSGPFRVERLGPDTLRPLRVEEWKSSFNADHPFAPVALQAVHGSTFRTSASSTATESIRSQAQEAELRFSFAVMMADFDAAVADALALRWSDKTAPKDKRILYRIISLDPEFRDTAEIAVNRPVADPPIPKPDAPIADEQDMSIDLRWDVFPETPVFTAFWLERSMDGVKWNRINRMPIIKTDPPDATAPSKYVYYSDTTISNNYTLYYYRVRGITAFAEISDPSEAVLATGRDKNAPPSPAILNPLDENGSIEIRWDYPDPPADLEGFLIGRTGEFNGKYEMLTEKPLPPLTRSFIDRSPDAMGQNYYVVYAKDTAGNLSVSMPAYGFLRDSIAPDKPVVASGSIDTSGVVRLHWPLGDNPDIAGYRVFFSNNPEHEFATLTPSPVADTNFVDTIPLNNLSKNIYYRIVAVDRNFNHSEPSDILMLTKPDIIPPVRPVMSNFFVTDSGVAVTFIQSPSDDVDRHFLMRRTSDSPAWVKIKEWTGKLPSNTYFDKTIDGATYYQYAISARDSAGNESGLSPSVDVRTLPKISREKITGQTIRFNYSTKGIQLSWNKPIQPVNYYVIYRGKDGRKPVSLTSISGEKIVFEDRTYTGSGTYLYMIKAVYLNGGESPIEVFENITVK